MQQTSKEYFMKQAMLEGLKALPHCFPNPPIGCVIVKDGEIIAQGHTNPPGKDHAEVMALKLVPEELEGYDLYVTLEPCSFQGRTPSCAKAIIKRNIRKIYVGIIDPHPKNQGAGIQILKDAGIEIEVGILKKEIKKQLDPYLLKEI